MLSADKVEAKEPKLKIIKRTVPIIENRSIVLRKHSEILKNNFKK
jgi:hypothetical protein